MDGFELLRADIKTLFVLSPSGRLVCENDPDRSPAPRFHLAGCARGNLVHVGEALEEPAAAELLALAAEEPPLTAFGQRPRHRRRYREILERGQRIEREFSGPIYALSSGARFAPAATLVWSATAAGVALMDVIERDGVPAGLRGLGFEDASHFWPPWCAATEAGELVSICFAARLSLWGAEAGVATAPAHRGRGIAAAVTAGWSRSPALSGRRLFYSTSDDNRSSQAVARRLRLPLVGAAFSLR
ncbi:MAG TPA: hypothetical protein VGS12_12245 [Caulobacteraceae bacterium]|nr:hypothetical protein [Caulobacteraceae bacterium]